MSRFKEKTLLLELWEKNGKSIVWIGRDNKKQQTNEEPFSFLYFKKPFYFYLNEFKSIDINDNTAIYERKIKIKNLLPFKQKEMKNKLSELNDEASLTQKIFYLNSKIQHLLWKFYKKENDINIWNSKAEQINQEITEFKVKKLLPTKWETRVLKLNKSLAPQINYLKATNNFLTQTIRDSNKEIDDLLEKNYDVLDKPNNIQKFLLEEKYENLKEKFLTFEKQVNVYELEFNTINHKLSKTKWEIKRICTKKLNKNQYDNNIKIKNALLSVTTEVGCDSSALDLSTNKNYSTSIMSSNLDLATYQPYSTNVMEFPLDLSKKSRYQPDDSNSPLDLSKKSNSLNSIQTDSYILTSNQNVSNIKLVPEEDELIF